MPARARDAVRAVARNEPGSIDEARGARYDPTRFDATTGPSVTSALRHHDVTLRGLRLHWVEAGEGPPLMLVHGILVSHKEWLPILPYLTPHFRCIMPDLPGSGASERAAPEVYPYTREAFAETLRDLLRALEISKAHVCGHSMGGGIALTFAADHGEAVDRLSVLGSACFPFPVPVKGRIPFLPGVGPFVFKHLYKRAVFRDYFKNDVWSGHTGIDLDRVDEYYADFDDPMTREVNYIALKHTIDVHALALKIPRITAPTTLVWGDDDRIFPINLAHRLVREIEGAKLHVIANSGHAVNEEHPERVAEILVAHHLGGRS